MTGIGGATGSSKVHTEASIEVCGAEVQKGNLQKEITEAVPPSGSQLFNKKCNDFGAGGVSAAIGELADGLKIDLDSVPKKYAGLTVRKLRSRESQEEWL